MDKKKAKIVILNLAPIIIILCVVLTGLTNKIFPSEGSIIFSAGGIFIGIGLLCAGLCLIYIGDRINTSAISFLPELALFELVAYAAFLAGTGQIIAWGYHFFK